MNKKIEFYKKLASEYRRKTSFDESGLLLKNKSEENKENFMNNFIIYVFNITSKIYLLNKDLLNNNSYDYEDFFNDAYLVALELYDKFIYDDNKESKLNIENYIDIFRKQVLKLLTNTYFMDISLTTWYRIREILEIKEEYFLQNGFMPTISEISSETGYSKHTIERACECVKLNNQELIDYSFEEKMIEDMESSSLYDDLVKIKKLSDLRRETLCLLFGVNIWDIESLPDNMSDLAKMENLSRNAIHLRYQKALDTIRKNNDFVKKYKR